MKQFIANMTTLHKILLVTLVTIVFRVCGYVDASYIKPHTLTIVAMISAIALFLFVVNSTTKSIFATVRKIAQAIEGPLISGFSIPGPLVYISVNEH